MVSERSSSAQRSAPWRGPDRGLLVGHRIGTDRPDAPRIPHLSRARARHPLPRFSTTTVGLTSATRSLTQQQALARIHEIGDLYRSAESRWTRICSTTGGMTPTICGRSIRLQRWVRAVDQSGRRVRRPGASVWLCAVGRIHGCRKQRMATAKRDGHARLSTTDWRFQDRSNMRCFTPPQRIW